MAAGHIEEGADHDVASDCSMVHVSCASTYLPTQAAQSRSATVARLPRSMTCAPPPKASSLGFEHVSAHYAGVPIMPLPAPRVSEPKDLRLVDSA
jgi:hypothetical protein